MLCNPHHHRHHHQTSSSLSLTQVLAQVLTQVLVPLQITARRANSMEAASSTTRSAAAEHGQPAAATDMEERTPLRELFSDQIGAAGSWDRKVYYSELKEYKYTWKGKEQTSRKLVVILLSLDADQYCLGFARAGKSGESLEALQGRFATGTVWSFPR